MQDTILSEKYKNAKNQVISSINKFEECAKNENYTRDGDATFKMLCEIVDWAKDSLENDTYSDTFSSDFPDWRAIEDALPGSIYEAFTDFQIDFDILRKVVNSSDRGYIFKEAPALVSKIKNGMTQAEVKTLLGKPDEIDDICAPKTINWYYSFRELQGAPTSPMKSDKRLEAVTVTFTNGKVSWINKEYCSADWSNTDKPATNSE